MRPANFLTFLSLLACTLMMRGPAADLALGQGRAVLASGNPPLTQMIVDKNVALFEYALEIRLSHDQRERFRQGLVRYWTENNKERIRAIVNNAALADQPDRLRVLRQLHQAAMVESLRRDASQNDTAPQVLVEAFDRAHSDRKEATRAKGFNDLIGMWKSEDYLFAEKNPYSGLVSGVGFTDSRKLEIFPDGRFKHTQVHQHVNGSESCIQQDAKWEEGTATVEGTKLVFRVKSGEMQVTDACRPALNRRGAIKPYTISADWGIRPHVLRRNETMLCWSWGAELSTIPKGGELTCRRR